MNTLMFTRPRRPRCRLLITVLASLGLSLAGIPTTPARAASITVTTTADDLSSNGQCSLREAIRSASLDQAVAGAGADTISLPAGDDALGIAGQTEDERLTGDLDLLRALDRTGGAALQRALHVFHTE